MCKVIWYSILFIPIIFFTGSFVLEYVFTSYHPCYLCSIERYLYLILFIILMVYYYTKKNLVFVPALIGFCVSVYHKMVQVGLFSTCHIFGNYNNFEQFAVMVNNAVPCTVRTVIFHIDLVWFNIVIFGFYTMLIFVKPKSMKMFFD